MSSFVLFAQASQPCMNFNISELVYLSYPGLNLTIFQEAGPEDFNKDSTKYNCLIS